MLNYETWAGKRKRDNAKARDKTINRPAGTHSSNFADQIDQIEQMQHTSQFIQQVIKRAKKIPCIILYTAEQISDLCRICCPPPPARSAVLGVDKTFNIGPLHATVTAYKNLSLIKRQTREHPIFIGPIFLHGNSDADTSSCSSSILLANCPVRAVPPLWDRMKKRP
jgi:hypothetical protein